MAASGAIVAATAAAAAASSAAASAATQSGFFPPQKIVLPELAKHIGREAWATVLTIGSIHNITGTLLDADEEWMVILGRNSKHFLVPVQRVLALRVEGAQDSELPRPA